MSDSFLSPAQLMQRYGLRAKKHFGQCFLHEASVAKRIVEAIANDKERPIVEIGAGLGALTSLLATRFKKIYAIERDRDLVRVLKKEFENTNVEIIEANALTFDFSQFNEEISVIGNLPYNISSPLLFHLMKHRAAISDITVMLQKELAQRLLAKPNSREYGAPTITLGVYADISLVVHAGKGAFTPAPNVDSTVLHLALKNETNLSLAAEGIFELLVRSAFSSRRKKLRKALQSQFELKDIDHAFEEADIDANKRAEQLSIDDFIRLTESMANHASKKTH